MPKKQGELKLNTVSAVPKYRVLRMTFGHKGKGQKTGENCIMPKFIICIHNQILPGNSNQGEIEWQDM